MLTIIASILFFGGVSVYFASSDRAKWNFVTWAIIVGGGILAILSTIDLIKELQ